MSVAGRQNVSGPSRESGQRRKWNGWLLAPGYLRYRGSSRSRSAVDRVGRAFQETQHVVKRTIFHHQNNEMLQVVSPDMFTPLPSGNSAACTATFHGPGALLVQSAA
jgi:hypothetical protein